MAERYRFIPPNSGTSYQWSNDHSFVKVSSEDTGGAYCVIEDNLSSEFSLGLHLHRQHAESFYILEGSIPFYIDGDWMDATAGSTIHVPPGIPHAVDKAGSPAKMIMVMLPTGFDQYLAALEKCSDSDFENPENMRALAERFDIFELGGVPPRPA